MNGSKQFKAIIPHILLNLAILKNFYCSTKILIMLLIEKLNFFAELLNLRCKPEFKLIELRENIFSIV